MLELRTRDTILSVAVFSVVVLVIFNFALDINSFTATTLAPGILWVAFTFAGILAVNRSIVLEHENNSFEGLLLTPVVKDKIFFGKMVSIFLFMIVVESILVPIFGIMFNFDVTNLGLIAAIFFGTLGFATVDTLFSTLTANTRSREILLPILFLPIVLPVLIAAVESTSEAVGGAGYKGMYQWLGLIGIFDVVFLVLCPWLFGLILEN